VNKPDIIRLYLSLQANEAPRARHGSIVDAFPQLSSKISSLKQMKHTVSKNFSTDVVFSSVEENMVEFEIPTSPLPRAEAGDSNACTSIRPSGTVDPSWRPPPGGASQLSCQISGSKMPDMRAPESFEAMTSSLRLGSPHASSALNKIDTSEEALPSTISEAAVSFGACSSFDLAKDDRADGASVVSSHSVPAFDPEDTQEFGEDVSVSVPILYGSSRPLSANLGELMSFRVLYTGGWETLQTRRFRACVWSS
jgi:hypothetical protein